MKLAYSLTHPIGKSLDMVFEGGGLTDLVVKPSLHTAVHHNSAD
jgi:hypothetical protein